MIYLNIQGGLGNQMFQYAAANALARQKKTNIGICLDKINRVAVDPDFTERPFELERVFRLQNVKFVQSKAFEYIVNPDKTFLQKIKMKLRSASFFYEKNLRYDPAIQNVTSETYLEGYFQSSKYFSNYEKEVLQNFQFRLEPSQKTIEVLDQIRDMNSVAVHVRRGDYIEKTGNLNTHGVCPAEYYHAATREFEENDDTCFVVVSDDPQWVKSNLNLGPKTIYVDWNSGDNSWQDMLIISRCKHAIIANSSFSWWGAMLNSNPDKKVVAPARWFADNTLQEQTADLIPTSWIKI